MFSDVANEINKGGIQDHLLIARLLAFAATTELVEHTSVEKDSRRLTAISFTRFLNSGTFKQLVIGVGVVNAAIAAIAVTCAEATHQLERVVRWFLAALGAMVAFEFVSVHCLLGASLLIAKVGEWKDTCALARLGWLVTQ